MFARSLRALLRVLLRQRSVREGALRRARNPVYLPRLSGLLRLRALRLQALRLSRLRALRCVKLLLVRLPRRFLLPARPLVCPPRLT